MDTFKLVSSFKPCGDQPQAIQNLTNGIFENRRFQTLLGVTGSGKTFTIANVIKNINRPVLVISHNKTLAAQLYSEFKTFFPENAVEYFVSYYDYYQPEAYIPQTDTYIEKDASINDNIDRLRLSATSSLLSRRDVIIVASVSCIYNLGSPSDYKEMLLMLEESQRIEREALLKQLVDIQYERNDIDFSRGKFRVRGEIVDIFPAYKETAVRVELVGDCIDKIYEIDPVTQDKNFRLDRIAIYPAKHFVTTEDRIQMAIKTIKLELDECVKKFKEQNKYLEAQRLETRTNFDIEMLSEIGYCHGVENYSRHLSGRPPSSRPYCLLDYFDKDFLTIIDESHVTIPQIRGMHEGDRARKETLVEYGFRLPSCLDNRPLRFDEFQKIIDQSIFVSATPSLYELERSKEVTEQLIRPTGLVDPPITVAPTEGQIDDLISRIRERAHKKERVLIITLTKRMAEYLSRYLGDLGLKVKYLHSEIDVIERVKILRDLRLREFDCLVGINLLREGLDLPEVSLVAILDADKEGFLRSQTSLIQTAGRCARNVNSEVVMYADTVTASMQKAIDETNRRRTKQLAFNKEHNITPRSIQKAISDGIASYEKAKEITIEATGQELEDYEIESLIRELEDEMLTSAKNLQFEQAILLRDQIRKLKAKKSRQ